MSGSKSSYHPEAYWNQVAGEIARRDDGRFIAGDDEPFYRYKRNKFLEIFRSINFKDRSVLEVGPGPGGNLTEVTKLGAGRIAGVDISDEMLALARKNLHGKQVDLHKVSNERFPFQDKSFDIVFTSTVLQHTTDDQQLRNTVSEICRVGHEDIYIFERIEKKIKGNESCLGRTVSFYEQLFADYGFELKDRQFLFIEASYAMAGLLRKVLNSRSRREGEKLTNASLILQSVFLPVTKLLDKVYKPERDLAMLHFKSVKS